MMDLQLFLCAGVVIYIVRFISELIDSLEIA